MSNNTDATHEGLPNWEALPGLDGWLTDKEFQGIRLMSPSGRIVYEHRLDPEDEPDVPTMVHELTDLVTAVKAEIVALASAVAQDLVSRLGKDADA